MPSPKGRRLSLAYTRLLKRLSDILYDEDPVGLGRTIAAPRDEYEPIAARLVVRLVRARNREQVERAVLDLLPEADSRPRGQGSRCVA